MVAAAGAVEAQTLASLEESRVVVGAAGLGFDPQAVVGQRVGEGEPKVDLHGRVLVVGVAMQTRPRRVVAAVVWDGDVVGQLHAERGLFLVDDDGLAELGWDDVAHKALVGGQHARQQRRLIVVPVEIGLLVPGKAEQRQLVAARLLLVQPGEIAPAFEDVADRGEKVVLERVDVEHALAPEIRRQLADRSSHHES